MAWHADRADRCRDRYRTGFGRHHLVADAGQEPLGRDIGVVDGAVAQDQSEFVAGETPEHVAAAQPRADAFSDFGDHGVGDVEAEGVVDARQMIDADQHEGAGRAEARGFLDGFRQRRDQMGAVEFAGERIVPRQPHQLLVAGVALIVDADDALRARRLAVGACEPAAGFLDPDHGRRGRGPHAIFDPVGGAVAAARRRRSGERVDRIERAGSISLAKSGAARQRFHGMSVKTEADVIAPGDGVGGKIPDESRLAERGQDAGGLRDRGASDRLDSGHRRVIPSPEDSGSFESEARRSS